MLVILVASALKNWTRWAIGKEIINLDNECVWVESLHLACFWIRLR